MIRVFATREGLEGRTTASGYVIEGTRMFVALPNVKALHRKIRIARCYPNSWPGEFFEAEVLDVGPHCDCDPYVFQKATMPRSQPSDEDIRPLAESGISRIHGKHDLKARNKAGIDLGGAVWRALKMPDNGDVYWEFID